MSDTVLGEPPSAREIESRLAAMLAGHLSRADAVAWARQRRDAGRAPLDQFGHIPRDPLLSFVFWALLAAEVSAREAEVASAEPDDYFIRDADLAEWLATLRHEDAPLRSAGDIRPLRFHQRRSAPFIAAGLALPCAVASERLGLEHLRGLDDLDYYQDLAFELPNGRQVLLEWRPRGGPDDAVVYLEGTRDAAAAGWSPDLVPLLRPLGLSEADVRSELLALLNGAGDASPSSSSDDNGVEAPAAPRAARRPEPVATPARVASKKPSTKKSR